MTSLITFEERYAIESERRRTKPFSSMSVRFAQVCPVCGDEMGLHGNCWNKTHADRPHITKPIEKVIVSYR